MESFVAVYLASEFNYKKNTTIRRLKWYVLGCSFLRDVKGCYGMLGIMYKTIFCKPLLGCVKVRVLRCLFWK